MPGDLTMGNQDLPTKMEGRCGVPIGNQNKQGSREGGFQTMGQQMDEVWL